ncbi:MAG: exodeoxyribonuclease VII large subunit [Nitrospira sp.]|nr:exodeoxyribonuclease VII large subunit [Candidatus Manganitrophaceae bacterium]HIL34790.1 exodeoxyribonuclease VII large subunit [Candidatus Manganitrophaceae bacterium]
MFQTDRPGQKILKVHELTTRIRVAAEQTFSNVWVEGEVVDLRLPASGHLYFVLKDASAQIRTIIFRAQGRFLKFTPKEGKSVLIRGHLTFYEARGDYQLIVDYIEPRGSGALQAAFEALKEALRREGLFDVERKKTIPQFPLRIGLLTSATGAVLRDILRVFQEAKLPIQITVYPVPVQGEGAAGEIVETLDAVNGLPASQQPELLILTRGGGSLEDLAVFNEEDVARAIFRSVLPVMTAIGHETDTTISDYVSDLRVPTPSIAAEEVARRVRLTLEKFVLLEQDLVALIRTRIEDAKNKREIALRLLSDPSRRIGHARDRLSQLVIRLQQSMARALEIHRGSLIRSHQGLFHLNPIYRLQEKRQRLNQLNGQLLKEGRGFIDQGRSTLLAQMEQLHLLSPLNILSRGYSITQKLPSLKIIRDATEVHRGDRLRLTLHQGRVTCTVVEKGKEVEDAS